MAAAAAAVSYGYYLLCAVAVMAAAAAVVCATYYRCYLSFVAAATNQMNAPANKKRRLPKGSFFSRAPRKFLCGVRFFT